MTSPNSIPPSIKVDIDEDGLDATFDEYKFVAEDTSKLSDRRQTVNNLFVTINVLFVTGGGYLLTQFTTSNQHFALFWYVGGLAAIAIIATLLNSSWMHLTENSRRLIDLRFRYLRSLEAKIRDTKGTFFTPTQTPLNGIDPRTRDYELQSDDFPGEVIVVKDSKGRDRRVAVTRGTYTLEDVLYGNPNGPIGFSKVEKRVTLTFIWTYWVGFVFASALAIIINWADISTWLTAKGL